MIAAAGKNESAENGSLGSPLCPPGFQCSAFPPFRASAIPASFVHPRVARSAQTLRRPLPIQPRAWLALADTRRVRLAQRRLSSRSTRRRLRGLAPSHRRAGAQLAITRSQAATPSRILGASGTHPCGFRLSAARARARSRRFQNAAVSRAIARSRSQSTAARTADPLSQKRARRLARAGIDRRKKPPGPPHDRRHRPPHPPPAPRAHRSVLTR